MDTRRLTAPLVAAGLLRRRPAAPPPDAVREVLADSRRRKLRVEGGGADAVLHLPAGAGPHPVVLLTTDATAALAGQLAAAGVAAVPVSGSVLVAAIAATLAGRLDVNPHEIGVIARADELERLDTLPNVGFAIDADAADLIGRVFARVTLPV